MVELISAHGTLICDNQPKRDTTALISTCCNHNQSIPLCHRTHHRLHQVRLLLGRRGDISRIPESKNIIKSTSSLFCYGKTRNSEPDKTHFLPKSRHWTCRGIPTRGLAVPPQLWLHCFETRPLPCLPCLLAVWQVVGVDWAFCCSHYSPRIRTRLGPSVTPDSHPTLKDKPLLTKLFTKTFWEGVWECWLTLWLLGSWCGCIWAVAIFF